MTIVRDTAIALLLLVATALGKDAAPAVVEGDLGRRLDALVAKYTADSAWGSVLVSRDGTVLLAKGYGFADYEEIPNTQHTLFELASASKQITAAAILHLEQRKKLSVEDTLERFFEEVPKDKRTITVHQLLTHTSGLSPEIGVPYASAIARDAFSKQMLATPLTAAPGEKFQYCNAGYTLLAAIVEFAGKTSFEEYCEKHLFEPAGMSDTGFIGDRDLAKSGRLSVRKTDGPGKHTAAEWHWGWGYRGMGGVVTTVIDLLKWDQALDGDDVLTTDSKAKLYTPVLERYAYGWKIGMTEGGGMKVHHSGSVAGYGANVVRYVHEDICIFVLSNDERLANQVTTGLEKLLLAPADTSVTLDATSYDAPPNRAWMLPEALRWKVEGADAAVRIRLFDGENVVVDIRTPVSRAQRLIKSLANALVERAEDAAGGDAASKMESMIMFPEAATEYSQEGDLELSVVTEDPGRGAPAEFRDVCAKVVLADARTGRYPFLSVLNFTATRELLSGLRAAAGH